MIEQLNIYGKSKLEVAIERLKTFEPPGGYYLAFSGGKDSVVIKALADMAGVKYDAHCRRKIKKAIPVTNTQKATKPGEMI